MRASWTSVRAVARAGRAALPEAVIEKATTELDSAAKAAAEGTAQAGADRARAADLNAPDGIDHLPQTAYKPEASFLHENPSTGNNVRATRA
jgi:hypothetical protein